jgi:hypothetical protein
VLPPILAKPMREMVVKVNPFEVDLHVGFPAVSYLQPQQRDVISNA